MTLYLPWFLPETVVDAVKLAYLRLKFSRQTIYSPYVSPHCRLGIGCSIGRQAVIGRNVSIGDYSYANMQSVVMSGEIGKYTSIGYNAVVGPEVHPTSYLSTSPKMYSLSNIFGTLGTWDEYADPPKIGSDVWIGANSLIMQGVEIGDGSVIGANSVVSRPIPPYAVAYGSPAKVARLRFSEKTIADLLSLRWWDLPRQDLNLFINYFHEPVEELHLREKIHEFLERVKDCA